MIVYHSRNCSCLLFPPFVPFMFFFCVCLCIEQIAAWKDEDGDWYETGLHIFCKLRFLVLEVLFMIFVFFKIISVINIQVAYTC